MRRLAERQEVVEINRRDAMSEVVFDHVSIAVEDAEAALRSAILKLGAIPLSGEVLPTYKYVLTRVGDAERGMQLELLEPQGGKSTFVRRFLDQHGERVHHLTFTVPNLEETVALLQSEGFDLVKKDFAYEPWREVFISPSEAGLGVVIQVAESSLKYPPLSDFISGTGFSPNSIPHNRLGTSRQWWMKQKNEVPRGKTHYLHAVQMTTTHLDRLQLLFAGILGARTRKLDDGVVECEWSGSKLQLKSGDRSGVSGLLLESVETDPGFWLTAPGLGFMEEVDSGEIIL